MISSLHPKQTNCQGILRSIYFYGGKTHPNKLAAKDVERFLPHLAPEGKVAASTQRQALNALAFLYREVIDRQLDDIVRINGEIPIAPRA